MARNRRDAKIIKNLTSTQRVIYYLKKKRCDSDVYINMKVDMTNAIKYIEKQKKEGKHITYFHFFCSAVAKTLYNRPLLNRFIMPGGKVYEHNDVSVGFVAKVKFEDYSEEYLAVEHLKKDYNLFDVSKKLEKVVEKLRNNKKNDTDKTADTLAKLPAPIFDIVMKVLKFMDNHDLLPENITRNSIYHSSIIVSNLGSFKSSSIYHNLTDFGTASSLITMGAIHKEPVANDDGKVEIKDVCDFGINLDERIGDGYYFVKSMKVFEYLLNHPELLEEPVGNELTIDE